MLWTLWFVVVYVGCDDGLIRWTQLIKLMPAGITRTKVRTVKRFVGRRVYHTSFSFLDHTCQLNTHTIAWGTSPQVPLSITLEDSIQPNTKFKYIDMCPPIFEPLCVDHFPACPTSIMLTLWWGSVIERWYGFSGARGQNDTNVGKNCRTFKSKQCPTEPAQMSKWKSMTRNDNQGL